MSLKDVLMHCILYATITTPNAKFREMAELIIVLTYIQEFTTTSKV